MIHPALLVLLTIAGIKPKAKPQSKKNGAYSPRLITNTTGCLKAVAQRRYAFFQRGVA
jgi:hypothetical protein